MMPEAKKQNERFEPSLGRLNPFQSKMAEGTLRQGVLAERGEIDRSKELATIGVSENGWVIVEGHEKPTVTARFGTDTRETQEAVVDLTSQVLEMEYSRPRVQSFKRALQFRPAALNDEQFQVLQKWEGVVLSLEDNIFWARLKDRTNDNPDEEVEIELDEVLPDDRELVEPGAAFYWSIGHLHKAHGQRIRASEIRFRRIPGWTEEDIMAAKRQVSIDRSFYNLDCGNSTV
jgi:hypothetical protein